ncbi:type II secretion system major pseudopilin GspG [Thioalkalivibrio sp. ALE30]|uniref:type II secretion system major pseudopilin GspG n=1 Tax=Thioalkalivibrio sp. ALE30 TaxID=1158181 RepID=UPI00036FC2F9|nr:type II secretion system major pseudopilin GspG [Thioalkalivibrio sp. ALE30]
MQDSRSAFPVRPVSGGVRGFTLIEIMVVVVILGILAAIVVPRVMDRPDDARITKVKQDIRTLESALNLYRLDNFRYPTTDQGLDALVERPRSGPEAPQYRQGGYMDRLPSDPWGNPYQYLNPGRHGDIDVFSFGANGRRGGEGIEGEIGNWNMDEF